MASLGVALVGTGFGQKVHLPALRIHPQTEVVAIYHRDRLKAQQLASQHHVPHASDNLASLLALPEVQAVAISTPPFLHYSMAHQAITAGKHILLEKPVTMTYTEAVVLRDLSVKQGVTIAVDFEFRYVPQWRYLHHLLRQGMVGSYRTIEIQWLMQGRADPQRVWNWYSQKSHGGGALGALGSHTFDYVTWLFGNVARLTAHLSTRIGQRPDVEGLMQPVDADDTCHLIMELADGTPCSAVISTVTHRGRGHWLSIYGDRGTLILGNANQADYVHGFDIHWGEPNRQELELLPVPPEFQLSQTFSDGRLAPFYALLDDFVGAITTQIPMVPGIGEGVNSQRLMDCARRSHETGHWVEPL
ncbi:MAG: Gfo/Idh/MocA family oxidoreductase [Oscillatoriales cyanobacterium SM2_2_1]|nr:Gfo/Idh/MocA family oxidoreductase [Oscillatoriales cyanobacterium SM2_2_1]